MREHATELRLGVVVVPITFANQKSNYETVKWGSKGNSWLNKANEKCRRLYEESTGHTGSVEDDYFLYDHIHASGIPEFYGMEAEEYEEVDNAGYWGQENNNGRWVREIPELEVGVDITEAQESEPMPVAWQPTGLGRPGTMVMVNHLYRSVMTGTFDETPEAQVELGRFDHRKSRGRNEHAHEVPKTGAEHAAAKELRMESPECLQYPSLSGCISFRSGVSK
ncbi:hypothetical protein T440DRAFT_470523 [Plenodomus tracheiphilus IPT5]|uniref:Uncharacterized protein n=1 Tax=Plenodomus tracheiphilus IPT5 TaxID=1408161 RepID=A0A6A7B1D9_9PLEO|nr:hypothetical protein T440DRAFT_470523 [Plenodomus tracheiphilus IPT5]